jgi:hypothetical protein
MPLSGAILKATIQAKLTGQTISMPKPGGGVDIRMAYDFSTAVLDSGQSWLDYLVSTICDSVIEHITSLALVNVTVVSGTTIAVGVPPGSPCPGTIVTGAGVGTIS